MLLKINILTKQTIFVYKLSKDLQIFQDDADC